MPEMPELASEWSPSSPWDRRRQPRARGRQRAPHRWQNLGLSSGKGGASGANKAQVAWCTRPWGGLAGKLLAVEGQEGYRIGSQLGHDGLKEFRIGTGEEAIVDGAIGNVIQGSHR